MTEPNADDEAIRTRAVANAAAALGLSAGAQAQTWLVSRMRLGRPGYVLVVFGAPQAAVGLAAVDRASGAVFARATLPGRGPHHLMSAEEAIRIAGTGLGTQAALVWDPGPDSPSPFYPLWQLQDAGRTVWVDSVTGAVLLSLETKTGGGKTPH